MSVGISGNTIIAGMQTNTYNFPTVRQGTVYVFVKSGSSWTTATESARLTIGSTSDDRFARHIAIDGNTIVASAWMAAKAYVFVRPLAGWATTSTPDATLQSGVGSSNNFGYSVAVSGDVIVVGHEGYKAHVFLKPGSVWTDMIEGYALTPSDAGGLTDFGSAVAISGDTVVVGNSNRAVNSSINAGAAYIFMKPGSGWANMTETAKLVASDPQTGAYFSEWVGASGSVIAVGTGSPGTPTATGAGSAYVFGAEATKAATTTAITGSVPTTSFLGQSVTVNFSVSPNPPTTGTPTGTVTISDGGSVNCTANVAAGNCSLTFSTPGSKTLTATYSGDTNFLASTSSSYAVQVKYGLYLPLIIR